ncbi:unnamed protein product [Closterium sp. NIES-65]|nr:unnamed protein product [Closterium sp. NIES-65]
MLLDLQGWWGKGGVADKRGGGTAWQAWGRRGGRHGGRHGAGVGAGILAGMGAGMRAGILAGMGAGMLDVLQPLLWVAVSPAVAEELLFRGLLFTTLQERLGRIDAAMLSAALFALFHLSLALLFPNMALGIAASLLAVYSKNVLPAVALHTTYNASALIYALMAATIASV